MATITETKTVRSRINISRRLADMAARFPDKPAVVMPTGKNRGRYKYRSVTYTELESDSSRIAAGLVAHGLRPGHRIVLLVRPGIDFVSLTFALFKAGAVTILIDPGMGRQHLIDCLAAVDPDGFVAVPIAHVARLLHRYRFRNANLNVTVGRRWFWRGPTLERLRQTVVGRFRPIATAADDPAAIIFTSGSTGPPKGVLYEHGNFDAQVEEIRDRYGIEPGGVDLAGFPLFGLFNSAMGMTTVVPDMDASRPASVDPAAIVAAVTDWKCTQSFASPAVWNVVSRYCEQQGVTLPTLRRVLSAGAPVPPHVLARLKSIIHPMGEVHTPYGATESLPIASIEANEVLEDTAKATGAGAGTCVGRKFSMVKWRVIRATDVPIASIGETERLPRGEIGELIVTGPMVTRAYVTRVEANAFAKIQDKHRIWHRTGDLGYFDDKKRFWFCGRKAHQVHTADGPMYPVPCESIANEVKGIYRSALVGVGKPGHQEPVLVCETWEESRPQNDDDERLLLDNVFTRLQSFALTRSIRREHLLTHPGLPVDVRHNSKINREQLAVWATERLAGD